MGNPGATPGACHAVRYRDVSCGIFIRGKHVKL